MKKIIVILAALLTVSMITPVLAAAPAQESASASSVLQDMYEAMLEKRQSAHPEQAEQKEQAEQTEQADQTAQAGESLAPAEEDGEESEFAFGTINGKSYENASLGLRCDFPKNWFILEQDVVSQINGYAGEAMGIDAEDYFANNDVWTDLYALDLATDDSINILVQKLMPLQAAMLKSLPLEDLAAAQEEQVVEGLENAGGKNITFEIGPKTDFPLANYVCLYITVELQGRQVYMEEILALQQDYMITITAAANGEDRTAQELAYFSAY